MSSPSPAQPRDPSKRAGVKEIRAIRGRLSGHGLRRLREGLFKLELSLVEDLANGGFNIAKISAIADYAKAIEVVEVLQLGARER